jgi:membrane associated rhomboid family serine protease
MLRLTPVVKNLIIINVIVFVAGMLAPHANFSECFRGGSFMEDADIITGYLALWNAQTDCFKPYQLFTYMFVHGGFSHIFFNMLTLAFIGPILESFWGPKRFATFYVVTGIGAAILSILVAKYLNIGVFGTMVGASGAIYGLLTGFGMLFPNMEVMLLIPPIPIKAKYLVFLMGGLTFLMDRSGQVAHFTHLGGIIFAFILIRLWRHQGGSHY